ncbi:Phosphoheptose isomerase [subsurface metagenome]
MEDVIKAHLSEHLQMVELLFGDEYIEKLTKIARMVSNSLNKGGKVVLFGNGGSAADAQHIAAELVGRFQSERAALSALALTTNTSIITAIANDYSFDQVFARQVESIVDERDIVIGISTSGNSLNVVKGIQAGSQKGAATIAFTGNNSSQLSAITDICLMIPSTETPHIQEAHIMLGHIICHLIEKGIYGKGAGAVEDNILIKVVALDIDGVLTDGTVNIDDDGKESKSIFYRDVDAIFRGRREGLQFALITGEDDMLVNQINKRLKIDLVLKGTKDKVKAITELSRQLDVPLQEICYIGDSDRDAPALEMVGLGVAPSNASERAKRSARYVCVNPGGSGAISEAIKKVLRHNTGDRLGNENG